MGRVKKVHLQGNSSFHCTAVVCNENLSFWKVKQCLEASIAFLRLKSYLEKCRIGGNWLTVTAQSKMIQLSLYLLPNFL